MDATLPPPVSTVPYPAEGTATAPDVTVTIVSWNTRDLLDACLASLRRASRSYRLEIHVVDNASSDGSPEMVQSRYPEVLLFQNVENVGFARANNQSWRASRGRYWMLLNSDTEVRPCALDRLLAFMDARRQVGLATARLINVDGTPQHCAQPIPNPWLTGLEASRLHKCLPASIRGRVFLGPYWDYSRPTEVGWTWGTALLARREVVEQVGALSEAFFMYGEDLEWCLRVRRSGREIWYCPDAEVLHHGGRSAARLWTDPARVRVLLGNVEQAIRMHRGWGYVAALHVATLAALGIAWLASRLRRRPSPDLSPRLSYHAGALMALIRGRPSKPEESRSRDVTGR